MKRPAIQLALHAVEAGADGVQAIKRREIVFFKNSQVSGVSVTGLKKILGATTGTRAHSSQAQNQLKKGEPTNKLLSL